MDGTGILFEPLLGALATAASTQVLSYPNGGPHTYEELLPVVRSVLPGEPFVLVAESFSGPLAIMLAAEHPAGLRGVVLCASFALSPVWWVPPIFQHIVPSFAFRFLPAIAQIGALLGGYGTPQLRRLLARTHAEASPASLAARVRSILAVNVLTQLRACSVPILYIRGSNDNVVPIRSLRQIQAVAPSIQVVTVLAPHLVLQVQPEACAQAILRFANNKSV